MVFIAILILSVFCFLVWSTYTECRTQESPKLIDISSGNVVFVAKSEHEAVAVIESQSSKASDGDVCYVRYYENGVVRTVAGIYNVAEGKVSITWLK